MLVIGASGVSAELCKNMVLAGIHSLTLLDDRAVTLADLSAQFLLTTSDIGKNLAVSSIPQLQKLNPNVEVVADTAPLATKPDAFFKQFTIVCSTSEVLSSLVRINQLCRDSGVKFFAAQVFGYYGMLFADLQKHEFVYDQVSINKVTKEKTSKKKAATYQYCSLEAALQFKWPTPVLKPKRLARKIPTVGIGFFVLDRFQAVHGRRPTTAAEDVAALQVMRDEVCAEKNASVAFVSDAELQKYVASSGCELGPVAAIMGGVLAGDMIKTISQKDTPFDNFLFFDGPTMEGRIAQVGSTNLLPSDQKKEKALKH